MKNNITQLKASKYIAGPIQYIFLFMLISISFTNAQSLSTYLSIAKENNPILTYHELSYDIAKESVDEVGNLDDTKFSLGYYLFPPETRLGPQRLKIGIQQSFPWPGTLKAQKQLKKTKAEEFVFDKSIEENSLLLRVKLLYYELYSNAATLHIFKENKEILRIYEEMALSSLENNKSRMSEVLKIRIQENELHSKIYSNMNNRKSMSNQFNRLLNRDVDEIVEVEDSLNVLDIILYDYNAEQHPVFNKLESKIVTRNEAIELIELERKPKFTAALDYVSVSERQDAQVIDNGRDILMPRIGVSVPFFNKKYDAKSKRLDIELLQINIQKYNQLQGFKNTLDDAKAKLENALLKVVAAQKNKDQIQRAIDSDLKSYETATIDFDNILKMQLQKIKYELMEIDATKQAYIQEAKLSWISGGR